LSSTSRSSASPPSSRVASSTSSPSYITSPLLRLGQSFGVRSPYTAHAPVAPTSPSRSASTVPPRISTPGISSHRSATPAVPSYRPTTPVSPSPVRKSRTMSISQPPPLPSMARWPAALTAAVSEPSLCPCSCHATTGTSRLSSLLILTLSSSPHSYSLHCSKQLTTLLRLAYILFMVMVRVRVGSQDSHLDNSNNTNLIAC
jgi:hypothetical protein